ncbi:hypothetical protein ALI144C_30325 [Actinosynnema sp. ALI-1.44]|nr:hypothetical protein ALI144C_30325 [Actinosynnema sp. ALI-1.44]
MSGMVGGLLALGLGIGATPALAADTGVVELAREARTHTSQTVVTVDSGAAVAFEFFTIKLEALRPASATGLAYAFPACVRHNGTAELAGGLKFTTGNKYVKVNSIVIDPRNNVVKASVAGRRIDVFSLNGQNLVLTAAGANALNKGLGFDGLFAEGFVFGEFVTNK